MRRKLADARLLLSVARSDGHPVDAVAVSVSSPPGETVTRRRSTRRPPLDEGELLLRVAEWHAACDGMTDVSAYRVGSLQRMRDAWTATRDEMMQDIDAVACALQDSTAPGAARSLRDACNRLSRRFETRHVLDDAWLIGEAIVDGCMKPGRNARRLRQWERDFRIREHALADHRGR